MRKNYCIFTIDYETWQPLPKGYRIDWKKDLVDNTNKLMDIFEQAEAKLTFMVEMCEFFWLCENESEMAKLVEKQIQSMILRGHDVQMHVHPNWMPECGVYTDGEEWEWNWNMASAETYPYDFRKLVQKCKNRLEEIVRTVKPDYKVQAYRAGAYRVQPFNMTYKALKENNIAIDTSVYRGGISGDRGYDFRKCKALNKPYWTSSNDPQFENSKGSSIIELPITTWKRNGRLFIDNDEAKVFAKRFLTLGRQYFKYKDNFFVMIGHSKGEHDYKCIREELEILKNYPDLEFTTIGDSVGLITNMADKEGKIAEKSIGEVQHIMGHLYNKIEPGICENNDKAFGVLEQKKALCCGYAVTLYTILNQYGYNVKCITAVASHMPKGRGENKIDTHELLELKFKGKKWILDPTANTVIPHGINKLLKNPDLATGKIRPDARYKEREYYHYDTSFFYRRVMYYKRKSACRYKIGYEGLTEYVIRMIYTYLFHVIPDKIRFYNIYRIWSIPVK